ncbi:Rhodanese-like domain-containing protein [Colletotrichum phormii]|uniref:Rhodanese-like domain-containing protein n=1 Tax=Colletotrichum phormii TaxID=359342 RepID=A0AAI9ZZN1_9PEZI|nr:Rhodanese-like domain-containing protein [Colletotrichum phormii]KAK1641194.1 Rhodanese-like domain-containing protein [Colletotrichum phormii]
MAPARACADALRASSSRLGSVVAPTAATRRCFAAAAAKSTFSARVTGKMTTARLGLSVTPAAAARTTAAARFFSSEKERVEDDYHQISANGSKIWDFSQMAELAKDPGNVVIVDAREPGELVDTGRIPTAINIPVATAPESFLIAEEDFEDRYGYPRPKKDTELVFYCKAGVRSRALATLARDAGWTKVGEYPGSWLDWAKKGGEVERGGKGPGQE